MKITFESIPLVRGRAYCEAPEQLTIEGSKELQVSSLLRAKTVKVFDRGNFKTLVIFKTTRRHNSSESARAYILTHAKALADASGRVVFEIEETQQIFYLHNASVKSVQSHFKGISSFHTYELLGSHFQQ